MPPKPRSRGRKARSAQRATPMRRFEPRKRRSRRRASTRAHQGEGVDVGSHRESLVASRKHGDAGHAAVLHRQQRGVLGRRQLQGDRAATRAPRPEGARGRRHVSKHPFDGVVESVSAGSGSAFSLLPPQNATGNWVKVTQRVPLRVRVNDTDPNFPLRIGTTSTVRVTVD